jgi:hypothetical protein
MNFHNPAQLYSRPMVNTRFRQQLRRQRVYTWSADKVLFLAVGKILLVLLPVVLAINLLFATWSSHLAASTEKVDNVHLVLMDKQIKLRAQRAQLYSPEQVQLLAAEKFSLHVPGKEQIKFF